MLKIIIIIPVFLFSLCVHEFAHAWVAFKKGDPTAKMLGRLTIHPLAHIDWIGTVFLPMLCLYSGMPFFGWAKPVPVDPRHFKNPLKDMALVALAGPLSNVLLALVSTVILAVLVRIESQAQILVTLTTFTILSIQVNLFLAAFNLIPVPPLDGSRILQGILPVSWLRHFFRFEAASGLLLLAFFLLGGIRYLSTPVLYCFKTLLRTAGVEI